MWTAIVTAILIITGIALAAGLMLTAASRRLPADSAGLIDDINALLPQTQCAQCGYAGCRPYAAAIAAGDAAINLCPPGGEDTVKRLAAMLGKDPQPLAEPAPAQGMVAFINEAACIGCTHCRDACPVDAIVGAHQLMHTIIAAECTGCELCLPPCPVDCISMETAA
jgi:electron transport complex protein RnfB